MNERATELHSQNSSDSRRVAVVGLGAMGVALSRTLIGAGHDVSVWNRTPKNLDELCLAGARLAGNPVDAVRGSDVVIVCVLDHTVSRDLVAQVAPALTAGVPLVNLSSGTSEQAVGSARSAAELGVQYVTGAIMVPTPLVGTDDNLVLYAGPRPALETAMPVLASLGGTVDVLGEDHALPPVLDMAMLDLFFVGMYAFLHSAAMARAHGIEPTAYRPYAEGIVATLAAELPGLAQAFEARRYERGQASLEMCLSFLKHIVATSQAAGVDPALPRLVRDATQRASDGNPGDVDWEVVVEALTRGVAAHVAD